MKETTKRILSLILAFVMVLGLLPGLSVNVSAAEGVIDAAIFCSDVHGSTSDLTSVLGGVATSGVDYSSIGFVGDTDLTVANTTSIVQSALDDTDIQVMFSYASSHDGSDIANSWDYSGEVEGVSENYLVYTIRETDMQNTSGANTAAPAFTTWYNGLTEADKALPIFILSHRPLHDRRDDNAGAATWYDAISTAAESSDIVFFWGHNHTGESSVDTAAYYVAKDGTETFTVYNGDTVVPNFTYMNAGYINANNQNPARLGIATTVQITADSLIFQDYSSSGEYTGTYAHNVTVEREFAAEEAAPTVNTVTCDTTYVDENGEIQTNGNDVAATGLGLTAVSALWNDDAAANGDFRDCVAYDVTLEGYVEGETVTLAFDLYDMEAADLLVYADGVQVEPSSVEEHDGYITVTLSMTAAAGTFAIGHPAAAEDAVLTGIEVTAMPDTTNYTLVLDEADDGNIYLDITGLVITASYDNGQTVPVEWNQFDENADGYALTFDITTAGVKTVTVTYGGCETSFEVTVYEHNAVDADVAEAVADVLMDGYIAKEFAPTDYIEGTEIRVVMPAPENANLVYHVADDGTLTRIENVTFQDGYVIFDTDHFSAYVVGQSTEIEVPDPETATGSGSTTTTTTKTVYVLTSSISSGNEYLIVNSNSAGSRYALANNSGSVAATGVTVKTDSEIGTYIELDDAADELWTVSNSYRFQNNGYYLRYNNGLGLSSSNYTTWSYSNNRLSYRSSRTTYYLRYNNGWTTTSSSSSATSIYFYIPTEVEVETTTDVSGTYSIEGTPAEVTKVVTNGSTVDLGSTLTFTPDSGEVTTTDTSTTAAYEIYSDPDGILSGISGNTVTFTGNYGKALVKVSYEVSFGEEKKTVTNYITVTATEPTYSIEITEADEVVTDTIIVKGVEAGDTHELGAKLFYTDENGQQENTLDTSKLTWASNDTTIATVNADGTVIFTGEEGSVQITAYYAYADGKQVTDTITISVSKFSYVVPGDGTDDFPEYPNQGAIRIDKTAVAQGTFSQTGIAKVELSMTGVPYGTSAKTDVILMVDMTSSMETNDITAAKLAAQELIESLVYDEENDAYDENIHLFVSSFSSGTSTNNIVITDHLDDVTISNSDELTAAKNAITDSTNGFRDDRHSTTGTHYGVALADVYETLNREGAAENQYVVFVTDGVPTRYYYLNSSGSYTEVTGSNSDDKSLAAGWFDDDGEVTDSFQTEYYTYLIKGMGVPVYTIGANLSTGSDASDLINHMSSNYSPDGKTATGETKYSFTCTTSGGVTDEVLEIFAGIGQDIREAAVNVVVEDKIADEYTVNFSLPSGVTADEAGMDDFYIQVLGYDLDENNERKADPEILEKFLFDSNGTITHTIGSNACGDTCTHVTYTDGVVTAIDGTYFDYASSAKGEFLTWNAEKLDRTELALEYFVYLDNSAGYPAAEQVDPGTYDTNEYAHITYTNFNGNECRQYFPVPSMTWNGAQVTYVFYLVNDDGQPVNRAGKIIPFAEAVYVTDPVTYDVTWNEETGTENLLAENLFASANVPDVYSLYDEQAYYEIRVYQTEGVDGENAVNYNYFRISGADDKLIDSAMDSDSTVDNSTTKVFNTKAGTKYDEYGIYSAQSVGTVLDTTDIAGNPTEVTTTVKTTDIDYANTTVAFAVVWKPELVEDVVVVDYGLDVVIDVYSNDGLAAGVTGVMLNAPANIENDGTYPDAVGVASVTSDDGLWTASRENLTSVRFHMNEMGISNAVKFYYEAGVNYYTYDSSGKATLTTTNMYSSVTVIPATTIYYEDEFVELKTFTKQEDGTYAETTGWTKNSSNATATQDQDRPGASKISDAIDADNNYGYDSAYETMSQFSMGSAAMATVKSGTYATAEFTFYGTGFDIISMTDTTTGTILIDVYEGTDTTAKPVVSEEVDTYYGYKRVDGEWVATTENDPNALYQVPVMKIGDGTTTDVLPYGQYTAVITVSYLPFLDPNAAKEGYDFYLDAIRVYNPTGNQDQTAVDAYIKDGEAYPEYFEVRDQIIGKETFDALEDETISGIVFIDGAIANPTIEDYKNYGPNNELYLAKDQAVAFDLNAVGEVAKIQLAVKTVGGTGDVEVYSVDTDGTKTAGLSETIRTATDMYYDITELNGKTVVIRNAGTDEDAIISITNVKVTYTAPQTSEAAAVSEETVETAEAPAMFSIRRSTASAAVLSLTEDEQIPEETEPETTVPEETEPETTEPETTVPEETEPETTEPEDDSSSGGTTDPIIDLIRKLLGWIFG